MLKKVWTIPTLPWTLIEVQNTLHVHKLSLHFLIVSDSSCALQLLHVTSCVLKFHLSDVKLCGENNLALGEGYMT